MSHLVSPKGHLKRHIYASGLVTSLVDEIKSIPKISSLKLDPAVTQMVVSKVKSELFSADKDIKNAADVEEIAIEVLQSVFELTEDEIRQIRNQLSYIAENKLDKVPSCRKRFTAAVRAFFFPNSA